MPILIHSVPRIPSYNVQITNLIHSTPDYTIRFTIEVWKGHSQNLLELQSGGQTAHSSDKLRVSSERSNGQGGVSMYVCNLDGDSAKFDWYGNCDGDVDSLAKLVR